MQNRVLTSVLVALALLAAVAGSVVYAAGAGERMPFLGGNVELHVASPLESTLVWSGTTLKFDDGSPTTVYPGQKIAEGVVRIKNVSPLAFGAYLRAEPQKVLNNTSPYFEIKVWIGETLFHGPKDIPAGTTMEMRVEIFIHYGAPVSSFQGLDVIVEVVPPPAETVAKCPASGCG